MPWWNSLSRWSGFRLQQLCQLRNHSGFGFVVTILMCTLCVNLAWDSNMSQNWNEPTLYRFAFSCFQLPSFSEWLKIIPIKGAHWIIDQYGDGKCEMTKFGLPIPDLGNIIPPTRSKGWWGVKHAPSSRSPSPMIVPWLGAFLGGGDTPNPRFDHDFVLKPAG